MSHVNNVKMYQDRYLVRSVRMFQDSSARMFQGNNARMSQGSNARMSQDNSVRTFQDNSVGMSPPRSAAMFPDRSAGLFPDSNVNKYRSKCVMLPSLLMVEGSENFQDSIFLQLAMITETHKEALNYNLILWKKPENLTLILMYLFSTGLIYSNRFCPSQNLVRV